MSSAFPSFSAFGGTRGLNKRQAKEDTPTDLPLSELKKGHARMVDTYTYDYLQLVRDTPEPFAQATEPVRVAVIGAGFAGATAAYELRRAGIDDITVYEGRGVGGRADSRTFKDENDLEYVSEMGPMRVPSNSKLFWHYLSEVLGGDGSDIQKIFPNPGVVATELVYRGTRYLWKGDDLPTPLEPSLGDANWAKLLTDIDEFVNSLTFKESSFGELTLGEIAGLLIKERPLLPREKSKINEYWSHFLKLYDHESFVGALEKYFGDRWGAEEYNMFSTLGVGTGGFGPLFPVCFLEIFRLFLWDYDNEYSPSLTMAEIVAALLDTDKIVEETVTYVGLNGDKVNVHSIEPDGSGTVKVEQYDYVIVATTLRSMQIGMNLDAEVSPARYSGSDAVFGGPANDMLRESLRIPHIMNSSKLFGFLPKKPWVDNNVPNWPHYEDEEGAFHPVKCVLTDTLARQMYYLDPHSERDDAGTNVLISYNWGDDSVKIMGILDYKDDQVINPDASSNFHLKEAYQTGLETAIANSPAAESLGQMGDIEDSRLESVIWQQEPLIFGAFKLDFPNQYYYISQLAYQYQYARAKNPGKSRRVYIAGNNISFQGGWIEGAMQSAVNAVSAVLKDMSDNGQANNFRMDNLFEPNPFQNVLDTLDRKYALPRK